MTTMSISCSRCDGKIGATEWGWECQQCGAPYSECPECSGPFEKAMGADWCLDCEYSIGYFEQVEKMENLKESLFGDK